MSSQRESVSNIIRNYFKRNAGRDLSIEFIHTQFWTLNISRRHITTVVQQCHASMPKLYRTGSGVYCYSPDVVLEEYVNSFDWIEEQVAEGNNLINPEDLIEVTGLSLQSVRSVFCSIKKKGYKVTRKTYYLVEQEDKETADV